MDLDLFTTAQWHASRTRHALQRALDEGRVVRVLKGVYKHVDVPDTLEVRARAVGMVRPKEAVVGREHAAWLSGLDVLPPGQTIADLPIRLIVDIDVTPPRLPGCLSNQAPLPPEDVIEDNGILRTTDLRTALDLGRFSRREHAVACLDAFLHAEQVSLARLWERAHLLNRVRNCRILRSNLAAADAGAESYAESAQRTLFLDAGLPRPRTQIPVFGLAGDLIGYLDMGWVLYLLGSEYDGEEAHGGEEQRAHDRHRRGRMTLETEWFVDIAEKAQVWGSRAGFVAHTAQLLLGRGWEPIAPQILDQITRAADYEARTGRPWVWMPLERLLAS